MRKKLIPVFVLAAVVGLGGVLLKQRAASSREAAYVKRALPEETVALLNRAERFVLLSIDPTPLGTPPNSSAVSPETFHSYAVLGKTEVRDAAQRKKLLIALYGGIADTNAAPADCFEPRHGVIATAGTKRAELLICFACGSIQLYGDHEGAVYTRAFPHDTFNEVLQGAGVPLPPDPRREPTQP